MEMLTGLLYIFLALGAGMAAERMRLLPRTGYLSRILNAALGLLLFSMGLRLGLMEAVSQRLLQVGIISLGFAVATVAGTAAAVIAVGLFSRLLRGGAARTGGYVVLGAGEGGGSRSPGGAHQTGGAGAAVLLEPLRLFALVAAGFLAGMYLPLFGWFREEITTWLLYLLLFLIGIQLIRDEVDLRRTLLRPATLAVPAATVAGSLGGGLIAAQLTGLSAGQGMALASGFGWYSLSGVLITNMGSPVVGAAAFLSNVLRETLALLLIPLFARLQLPHAAIGIAGATSMDVTLPLVERSCGSAYVPLSIAHGALLSLLVPFLVPLLFHL